MLPGGGRRGAAEGGGRRGGRGGVEWGGGGGRAAGSSGEDRARWWKMLPGGRRRAKAVTTRMPIMAAGTDFGRGRCSREVECVRKRRVEGCGELGSASHWVWKRLPGGRMGGRACASKQPVVAAGTADVAEGSGWGRSRMCVRPRRDVETIRGVKLDLSYAVTGRSYDGVVLRCVLRRMPALGIVSVVCPRMGSWKTRIGCMMTFEAIVDSRSPVQHSNGRLHRHR